MALTLSELTAYLLEKQYVHPDAVTDGDLSIVDTSSRHTNVMVNADPAVRLFLKQGRSDPVQPAAGWTGPGTTTHEAVVYRLFDAVTQRPRSGGRSLTVPDFLGFDPDHDMLVLALFPDATSLISYHLNTRRFPAILGTRLGAALAELHQLARGPARERPSDFIGQMPWALGFDRPGTSFYHQMSSASIQLVQMVQSSPGLREALAALRAGWRDDAFIHHDMKLENCLVLAPGASGRHTRLALVDWELADLGDAGWDIGSVFASYLNHWLISFPVTSGEEPDHYLDQARFPLERMHRALRAFWTAYVSARGWSAATADEALVRSVGYAGARLLQTACERSKYLPRVSTVVVSLTQLAENVLTRPEEAAEHLLGLSPRKGTDG
jgi:hypothetical protein